MQRFKISASIWIPASMPVTRAKRVSYIREKRISGSNLGHDINVRFYVIFLSSSRYIPIQAQYPKIIQYVFR